MATKKTPPKQPDRENRKPITIRLDPAILARSQKLATEENRTFTNYIETLLIRELERQHASEDWPPGRVADASAITVIAPDGLAKRFVVGDSPVLSNKARAATQELVDALCGAGEKGR